MPFPLNESGPEKTVGNNDRCSLRFDMSTYDLSLILRSPVVLGLIFLQ